jgi:hypothetical protein
VTALLRVREEDAAHVAQANFIVSSRYLIDPAAPRLQHRIVSATRRALPPGQSTGLSIEFELKLEPAEARGLLRELHARFETDDLNEVIRMQSAHRARVAHGSRSRRSIWKYENTWKPDLATWNYNSYNMMHWDEYTYQLYTANIALRVNCIKCYFSMRMPTTINVDWGK